MRLESMDQVRDILTSEMLTVNSAHYLISDLTGEQGVSVIGRPDQVFPANDFELIHRCDFLPHKGIKRCRCGSIYTTMADTIRPTHVAEH